MMAAITSGVASIWLLFMLSFMTVNGGMNRILFRFVPLVLALMLGFQSLRFFSAYLP